VDRVRESAYKEGFEDGQVKRRRQSIVHHTHQTQTPEPSVSAGSRCESLGGRSSAIASRGRLKEMSLPTSQLLKSVLGWRTKKRDRTPVRVQSHWKIQQTR
jgi:hypothetical protein